MRKRLIFGGLVLAVLLGSFSVAIAEPPTGKVDVCHQTSSETNPEVPITIARGAAANVSDMGAENGQGVALADDSGVAYGHRNDPIGCSGGDDDDDDDDDDGDGPSGRGGFGGGRTTDASVNNPELAFTA